ncbi:MAG: hypothetical protein WEB57_10725 [Pseudohongiellaceae bacterium]
MKPHADQYKMADPLSFHQTSINNRYIRQSGRRIPLSEIQAGGDAAQKRRAPWMAHAEPPMDGFTGVF